MKPSLCFSRVCERAQALLTKNAKVYIAARSEDRAKAAIEDLKRTTGNEAIWLKLDLSSLESVRTAAEEFLGWVHSDLSWAANTLLVLPSGKNQNSTFYSITRAFCSLTARTKLSLPCGTVALWAYRLTRPPLMDMT